MRRDTENFSIYSVILLDEMEKAHPDVFNILLQVLDDGRLTDGQGRVVSFKNTIIIMTSNVGSQYIAGANASSDPKTVQKQVNDALRATFKPEFLNRIDEIVVFDALTPEDIRQIVRIQMEILRKKLEAENVELSYTRAFEDDMVENGYDPVYGARPVKRLIQRELVNKLAREILEGKIRKDSRIEVDCVDGQTVLRNR